MATTPETILETDRGGLEDPPEPPDDLTPAQLDEWWRKVRVPWRAKQQAEDK